MSCMISLGQEETMGQEYSSAPLSSFVFKNILCVNVGGETGLLATLWVTVKMTTTSSKGSSGLSTTF